MPLTPASQSQQDALRRKGFESGEPVFCFYRCFTKDDMQNALFNSTYSRAVTLWLKDSDPLFERSIPVVLTRIEPRYAPNEGRHRATHAGSYEEPDWYLEGWIPRSGYDATDGVVTRVRIVIDSAFEEFQWQVIPARPLPDDPIEYGD